MDNSCNQNITVAERKKVLRFEKAVLDQWKEEDDYFFPTRACKEVESKIKNQNLVIVTGHSGSGKSAIIQHIALKYKDEGWIVKPVNNVKEMIDVGLLQNSSTNMLFVSNDPIGYYAFDEVSNRV